MVMRAQELHCHRCDRYVQFEIDEDLNGNHEIKCPNCGHIHYRYVQNGQITDIRYKSSGPVHYASVWGTSTTSTWSAASNDTGGYLQEAWMTSAASSTGGTNWNW